MSIIKRLIPNNLKQEGKYFLYRLLKIPYNRAGVPQEIIDWLPKDNSISYIDIGASVGGFSSSIASYYHVKRGVIIEPLPQVQANLKEQYPNEKVYSIINCAVSDHEGEIDFFISEEFHYISSLFKLREDFNSLAAMDLPKPVKTTVKTQTLDNIVNGLFGDVIDLLKIDVQGAEHLVLDGAGSTLKKTKIVYTEFSFKPMYAGSSVFFDLHKIMDDNNFRLVNISDGFRSKNGELLQGDALFVNNTYFK